MATHEYLGHQAAERVADHDDAAELQRPHDGGQVVGALVAAEAPRRQAPAVTAQVGRDDVEAPGEDWDRQRPVQVGGRHEPMEQQDGGRSGRAVRHADKCCAPTRKLDEPALWQLVREVKVREVQALDRNPWAARGTGLSGTGLAEHFSPPAAPGGAAEARVRAYLWRQGLEWISI